MELQIRKDATPLTRGCTVIADVETDGRDFYEEFSNPIWAEQFVNRWNEHDTLKAKADLFDELEVALKACVNVMTDLPTLNGWGGLAVLENAKSLLSKCKDVT